MTPAGRAFLSAGLALVVGGCALLQPAAGPSADAIQAVAQQLAAARADRTVAEAGSESLANAEQALEEARRARGDAAEQALYHARRALEMAQEAGKQADLRIALERLARRKQDLQQQLAKRQEQARAQARLQAAFRGFDAVEQTSRGLHLRLPLPNFSPRGLRLSGRDREALDRLVGWLHKHPHRNVMIETFTDNTGTTAFNLRVTSAQARELQKYLVSHGVNAARVVTRAYGEAYPLEDNATPVGRVHNRRAEIVISNESGVIPPRATPPTGH